MERDIYGKETCILKRDSGLFDKSFLSMRKRGLLHLKKSVHMKRDLSKKPVSSVSHQERPIYVERDL